MQKTYKPNSNLWSLDAEEGYSLHRKGSGDYPEIRHTTVRDPDNWEEIAVADIPPYTEAEYKAKVSELIHERYSIDDEIALAANASSPMIRADEERAASFADEYAAYQAYRTECKARAKEILSNPQIPQEGGNDEAGA